MLDEHGSHEPEMTHLNKEPTMNLVTWTSAVLATCTVLAGCANRPDIREEVLDTVISNAGWRYETLGDWDIAFCLKRSTAFPDKADLQLILIDPDDDGADDRYGYRFGPEMNATFGVGPIDTSDLKDVDAPRRELETQMANIEERTVGDWLTIHAEATPLDDGQLKVEIRFEAIANGAPIPGRARTSRTMIFDTHGDVTDERR
jgi:hypothetical protein